MKHILRKLLPYKVKVRIREMLKACNVFLIDSFASSNRLSQIYYLLINNKYRFEQRSILKGRQQFYKHSQSPVGSSPQLRRNVHRLEKGLSISPRRLIFAEAYIVETIKLFENSLQSIDMCNDELLWAKDILDEYFSVVGDSEATLQARKLFSTLTLPSNFKETRGNKSVPYTRAEGIKSDVSYSQLLTLFQQRRSVRWYSDKPVSDSDLELAIDGARLAPSACNRQPFEFLIIDDPELAPKVAAIANGTAGFAEKIKTLILVVGDLSCYPTEADRHVIYIDSALASMQLMLSLESLGLSSCPINWPEIEQKEYQLRRLIKLPLHKRVVMFISVGYAEQTSYIPSSVKKSINILKTSPEKY